MCLWALISRLIIREDRDHLDLSPYLTNPPSVSTISSETRECGLSSAKCARLWAVPDTRGGAEEAEVDRLIVKRPLGWPTGSEYWVAVLLWKGYVNEEGQWCGGGGAGTATRASWSMLLLTISMLKILCR